MMARRISGNSGGAVTNRSAQVAANTTGNLYTLRAPLRAPISWSKVSGDANLSVSGSSIALAAGLADGASQSIVVRGSSGSNAVEFQVTLTGRPGGGASAPSGYAFVTTTDSNGNRVIVTTLDGNGNHKPLITRIAA